MVVVEVPIWLRDGNATDVAAVVVCCLATNGVATSVENANEQAGAAAAAEVEEEEVSTVAVIN